MKKVNNWKVLEVTQSQDSRVHVSSSNCGELSKIEIASFPISILPPQQNVYTYMWLFIAWATEPRCSQMSLHVHNAINFQIVLTRTHGFNAQQGTMFTLHQALFIIGSASHPHTYVMDTPTAQMIVTRWVGQWPLTFIFWNIVLWLDTS